MSFAVFCCTLLGFIAVSGATQATDKPPIMVLPGKFDVNSMGAATYTIPLMVPPGTAGMKPDLSLDYSSNYADGPEGLGWALGGLPAITRCARTNAQDEIHGSVNFDANDRFCLNGQRLIAISGTYGANGTAYRLEIDDFTQIISYGQSGSGPTYFLAWTKAGQKMQFGNLSGNPNGTAASSPLVPVAGSTTGPSGTVRSWAVDTIWDTKGNYERVIYDNGTPDTAYGQLYPTRINYTANDGHGLTPYNSVRFVYAARTDVTPTYQAGSLLQLTELLTDIKTYQGSSLVHDYQLVYQTAAQAAVAAGLTSSSATAFHDELRTVAQCDGNATCLPATTIGWQGGVGLPPMNPVMNDVNYGGGGSPIFSGDFNGDGITDALSQICPPVGGPAPQSIWFGTGGGNFAAGGMSGTFDTGQFQSPTTSACLGATNSLVAGSSTSAVPDINGDGFSDVLSGESWQLENLYGGYVDWLLNNQQGTLNQAGLVSDYGTSAGPQQSIFGDFNGDGLYDYFTFTSVTGGGSVDNGYIQPITGTAQFFFGALSNGTWSFTGGTTVNFGTSNAILQSPILAADFDGDGCADLLTQGPGASILYSCNPATSSVQIPNFMPNGLNAATQIVTGDFNGDGKTDVLEVVDNWVAVQSGSNFIDERTCAQTTLYLSTGTALVAAPFTAPSDWCKYIIVTGDFNGDGKTDIALIPPGYTGMYSPPTPISIWLSTGTGFVQAGTITNQDACSYTYVAPGNPTCLGASVADWNSDGAADIWLSPGNWQNLNQGISPLYTFAYKPELVTSIGNSIGGSTTIAYGQLNNPTVYTKGSGATYPTQDVADTQYVVSQVQTNTGVGGTFTKNYSYAGAKKDLSGRGFLGFSQMTVVDPQNDITTTTNYFTAFPFTGLPSSQTEVCTAPNCPGNVTLKSTTYCYSTSLNPTNCSAPTAFTLGSGVASRYFVPARETVVVSNDLNGAHFPTVTTTTVYDCDSTTTPCYGDVTQVQAVSTDPSTQQVLWTKTTTNTYTDDATDWLLGRLLTSNIESVFGTSNLTRHTAFCYDLPYTPSGTSCASGGTSGLLLTEVIEPSASDPTLIQQTNYVYDAFGNKLSSTVEGCVWSGGSCTTTSRVTGATWDSLGEFVVTTTDALGHIDTYAHDPRFGGITSHTDPNNLTTTGSYDTFGRPTVIVKPDHNQIVTAYAYCSGVNGGMASCPTYGAYYAGATPENSSGGQNDAAAFKYYDFLGRVVDAQTETFNAWVQASTLYDALGRVAQTSRPYLVSGGTPQLTTYSHDALGRVTQELFPDGSTNTYLFSGLSNSVTNGDNQTTTTVRNAQGLVASVIDANTKTTSYNYDGFGDLTNVTDPLGYTTTYTYDLAGRKTVASDPDMGSWSYAYDGYDELATQIDAKNQTTTLSYDALGRVTQRIEPGLTSNWVYDTAAYGIGKLTSACTGTGCTSASNATYFRAMTYDILGRPSTATLTIGGANYVYTDTYNGDGRIASVAYPSGFLADYSYNSYGFLTQITDNATGKTDWTVNTRDAEFHLTQGTAGNGVVTNQTFFPQTGRLQSVCATPDAGTCDGATANFSYNWDPIGNLLSRSDTFENYTEFFCYDPLNRLTNYALGGSSCTSGTTVKSATYNAIGNIATKSDVGTYTYGGPNDPTGSFSASPTSIVQGNSTTLTWSSSSNATSASINNGVGGVTPVAGGSVNVAPSSTTTYTLTLSGSGGTTPYQATVTVTSPPPTGTFSASPTPIASGQSSTLSWTSSNATSASIDNGVGGVTPVSGGSVNVSPTVTTTYTLSLSGPGGGPVTYQTTVTVAAPQVIFLTSGTSWTVPSNWNSANNTVQVIGPGGNGAAYAGAGGGGGAYAMIRNVALTPGNSVPYQVGTGGSGNSTWFFSTSTVLAQPGATGGAGGAASSSVGSVRYSGGSGGSSLLGGGGGAAGPNGAGGAGATKGTSLSGSGGGGADGGTAGSSGTSTAGGNGGNGHGGGGGGSGGTSSSNSGGNGSAGGGGGGSYSYTSGSGGNGASDAAFNSSYGSGGGGGSSDGGSGGSGSTYGGGGGAGFTAGSGAGGLIVITYVP